MTQIHVGGVGPGSYATIQAAINASVAGDTIVVDVLSFLHDNHAHAIDEEEQ